MIRIDLGSDDKRGKPKGGSLFKGLGKLKLPGGKEFEFKGGLGRVKQAFGNLGAFAILLIAAGVAALPHIVFLQYRLFVVNEHEARKAELQTKISAIEKEIGKLKPYKKELESYEAQKTLVKERIEVIRQLLSQRGTPVNVLDAIGQALPPRVWITSLEFDLKGAKPAVKLEGQSLTNEDISDYVDKLSESVHLQDVNLEKMEPVRSGGTNAFDAKGFSLSIVPKGLKPLPKPPDPNRDVAKNAAPNGKAPAGAPDKNAGGKPAGNAAVKGGE